jgi:TPR repeat protein
MLLPALALLCLAAGPSTPPAKKSSPRTTEELEKAALAGDAEAQLRLGLQLGEAGHDAAVVGQSRLWLREAAQQGHVLAQYELGRSYADSSYPNRNPPRAVKWLTRAAQQGHAGAWLALGNLYASGAVGVLQDLSLARECYKKAEKKADGPIWESLGRIYLRGGFGLMDWPQAYSCYLQAARAGQTYSQLQLGQMYQHGVGTDVNPERAAYWFGRAAQSAKKGGYIANDAGLHLAWCYEHGFGVSRSRDRALAEYRRLDEYTFIGTDSPLARQVLEEKRRGQPRQDNTPVADGLELTLETERKEYQVDDLVVVRVCYRNVGKQSYSITSGASGGFDCPFEVRDKQGKKLPYPFKDPSDIRFSLGGGLFSTQVLGPGQRLVQQHTLSSCAHIDRPGTYTITAEWEIPLVSTSKSEEYRRVISRPLRLRFRAFDAHRRQETMDRLVEAYRAGTGIPEGMARPAEQFPGSEADVLRLLAFYCEPRLIPFFLDVLERSGHPFAERALWGMPDRAALIRAYEERLEHPEKYNSPALIDKYFELITPNRLGGWLEKFPNEVRQLRLKEKYRGKAMQVLRRDTAYSHPRLVKGLLGEGDDLFLIDYLIRCRPGSHDLSGCASALGRVRLEREHIPFLESLLNIEGDTSLHEATLAQLVRLDRRRYLPEVKRRKEQLSPEVVKVLLDGE